MADAEMDAETVAIMASALAQYGVRIPDAPAAPMPPAVEAPSVPAPFLNSAPDNRPAYKRLVSAYLKDNPSGMPSLAQVDYWQSLYEQSRR